MEKKLIELQNKKALVTGATGGIGEAIVRSLHKQGAIVTISGSNAQKLEKLKNNIGNNIFIKQCNLQDTEEVNELVPQAAEMMGGMDIVICNAGITKDNLIIRMKNEDFSEVIKINLESTFVINKAAVKLMMKNRWGRIINISSVVGVAGNPGQANYCASKAGMIGMSKSIAQETASRGITVNCIAPGFIQSPMTEKLNEEQKKRILNNIPCGKMGEPQDIANITVFLASAEAGYITGQTIHVNGGMLMV